MRKFIGMRILQEEIEGREKLQELEVAKARKIELRRKSQEELKNLEQDLPKKYMGWVLGRSRKTLASHKTKIREVKALIEDCESALEILDPKIKATWIPIHRATRIRERILERVETAKKAP